MAALAVMIGDIQQDLINGRAVGAWPGLAGFRQGALFGQLPLVLYRHQDDIAILNLVTLFRPLELIVGVAPQHPGQNLCEVAINVLGIDKAHGQIRRQMIQERFYCRRATQ